jgi:hypothetical protein
MMYEEIARSIRQAELSGQQIAMFHYQVLANADRLKNVRAGDFCEAVGMKQSFATEFSKMIALAKLMGERGVEIR